MSHPQEQINITPNQSNNDSEAVHSPGWMDEQVRMEADALVQGLSSLTPVVESAEKFMQMPDISESFASINDAFVSFFQKNPEKAGEMMSQLASEPGIYGDEAENKALYEQMKAGPIDLLGDLNIPS